MMTQHEYEAKSSKNIQIYLYFLVLCCLTVCVLIFAADIIFIDVIKESNVAQTFNPTVLIRNIKLNRHGSGVIIDKRLILTAHHVVSKEPDSIRVIIDKQEYHAKIIIVDEENDLALLTVENDKDFIHIANILPSDQNIDIYEETYTVGYPLTNDPMGTIGNISSLSRMKNGQIYVTVTSQAFLGNSGGPVYTKRNGRFYVIGIVLMIEGFQYQGIPYIVYVCDYKKINNFLQKEQDEEK